MLSPKGGCHQVSGAGRPNDMGHRLRTVSIHNPTINPNQDLRTKNDLEGRWV